MEFESIIKTVDKNFLLYIIKERGKKSKCLSLFIDKKYL